MPLITPIGAGPIVSPEAFSATRQSHAQNPIALNYVDYFPTVILSHTFTLTEKCDVLAMATVSVDWAYFVEVGPVASLWIAFYGPGGMTVLSSAHMPAIQSTTQSVSRPRTQSMHGVAQNLAPGEYTIEVEGYGLSPGHQSSPNHHHSNVSIHSRNLSIIEFHNRG